MGSSITKELKSKEIKLKPPEATKEQSLGL
jgi:hypothetical protein